MTISFPHDDRDSTVPTLSVVLGYGPMLPIVLAALATWAAPHPWPIVVTSLGILWAAAILIFLGGVRRGLSFRTPGGARLVQLGTMVWFFVLGIGAFVAPNAIVALSLLIVGYASVAILDPIAARREEAPAHFARFRPWQMALGVVSLLAMLIWQLTATVPFHPMMV